MNLLLRTFHDLGLLLRKDLGFSLGLVVMLALLEVIGRQLTSDFGDLFAGSMLGVVVLLVMIRHRQQAVGWLEELAGLFRRGLTRLRQLRFEIGIDLRGTPPLPRTFPGPIRGAFVLLLAWSLLLALFGIDLPHGFRQIGTQVFYLGYLVCLALLWLLLLLAIAGAIFIPRAIIHDLMVGAYADKGRRMLRWELTIVACYFGGALVLCLLLPPWVPLAICLLALLANLLTLAVPANSDVGFVWRRAGDRQIRSVSWRRLVSGVFTIVTLAAINLMVTSAGGVMLRPPDPETLGTREIMPLTATLGLVLTWLAPGALWAMVIQTIKGRLQDPARPCPVSVHLRGELARRHRPELKSFFGEHGWKVRFHPARARANDVCLELIESPEPVPEEGPTWPRRITLAELGTPLELERLARRDVIQKRRRLMHGLEKLFRHAAARRYKGGSGFWLAPQYWFLAGLSRDSHDEELEINESTTWSGVIGPSYHKVLTRPVRHHVYQMFRALEIDLIFVEDGVKFRRLGKVLRLLFEVYDVYGGRRRADEIHLQGVPGVRVMIHEFQLDEPFKSELYPEPEFENLGRARILHVFRDRGEETERLEPPVDVTNVPVPSLAL
jgi:hypothetical protein